MSELTLFSVGYLIRKLREINPAVNRTHSKPFPKEEGRWLSRYRFRKEFVQVNDDGSVRGGLSQFVASIIDFSFVRSIAADAYSIFGGPCYDPVSLFLLDLFRYLDRIADISHFCAILRDPQRGLNYRRLAGLTETCTPCEATFSNFRARLGESRYQQIFHALVSLVHMLGLLSFDILATDGTLFPSAARYRGCCCFRPSCASIAVNNIAQKVHDRVLYRIEHPAGIVPGKESRVAIECPNPDFIQDVRRPRIPILSFTLETASDELSTVDLNNLRFFRLEEPLTKLGLVLKFPESNVHGISVSSLISEPSDTFRFRCPRLPRDTTARIGVRRNPANPDKIQKIFGYNAVITTAIDPRFGLELPVACLTIAGNADEGNQFIPLQEQIRRFHPVHPRIHLLDAKYDELHNYAFARSHGAVPLIDYNPRNEKLSREALLERGYDRNGWPYVPYCHFLCRPNGFDTVAERLSFSCFKQCLKSSLPSNLDLYRDCPHRSNRLGFSTHVSVAQHPRLILEIPRGSERYHQLHALRSAAERTNSTLKDDKAILRQPPVMSLRRAAAVAQMGVITTLIDRVSRFVLDITVKQRKFEATGNQHWFDQLSPPEIPPFLQPFVRAG